MRCGLHARDVHAGAGVVALAEGDVAVGLAPDVERSGAANCAGSWLAAPMPMVTGVRRAGSCRSASARGGEAPVVELDRPVVAQHLLDRARHQSRVGAQPCHFVRMPEQQPEAVADQVGGGLVPGV